MRKQHRIQLGIVLTVCLGAMLVSPLRYSLIGLVKNERFYLLRPTSYWLKLLKDEDVRYRQWAARSLGQLGPEPGVVLALAEKLKDKHWSVHCSVAKSLGQIGPPAKEAVPALVEALKHADADTGKIIIEALKSIDPDAALKAWPKTES
jgi:hypothetical protein